MLLLPTGVGGVLYRPRFFNLSIAFSKELWEATPRGDDLTFRIATLAMGIKVYTACILGDFKDKKRVTNCPDLNGVDFHFEKIARRLEIPSNNTTVLHSNNIRSVRGSGGRTNLRRTLQSINNTHSVTSSDNSNSLSNSGTTTGITTTVAEHTTKATTVPATTTSTATTTTTAPAITGTTTTTTATGAKPILIDTAAPKRNIDHGDKGSLSSLNSKHDGNFHQWTKATHYLKESNLFDINAFIQSHVVTERTPCVINPALLNYNRDSWLGSITGSVMENLQSLTENYRDNNNRCGIVSCKNPRA